MTIGAPWWLQPDLSIGLFFVVFLGALILAFTRGGAPERRGGAILIAMAVWQYSAHFALPPRFSSPDAVSLLTDVFGLAGFGLVALSARRIWPIWASALQLLSLSGHFARWIEVSFHPIIYAWMRTLPTAGAILALLLGTIAHARRMKRFGDDPSWQDWASIERQALIRRHRRSSRR